jgi:hypothetical protein
MKNPCERPFKFPKRKMYEVLTGYTKMFGRTERLFFTKVWANSAKDAIMNCDSPMTFCGEYVVERIDE